MSSSKKRQLSGEVSRSEDDKRACSADRLPVPAPAPVSSAACVSNSPPKLKDVFKIPKKTPTPTVPAVLDSSPLPCAPPPPIIRAQGAAPQDAPPESPSSLPTAVSSPGPSKSIVQSSANKGKKRGRPPSKKSLDSSPEACEELLLGGVVIGTKVIGKKKLTIPKSTKPKKPKKVKCGTCEGCLATEYCGTCNFCTNENPASQKLCFAKRCKNKIVVEKMPDECQGDGEAAVAASGDPEVKSEPVIKMKKTKCNSCSNCKASPCGSQECKPCAAQKPWFCKLVKCLTPVLVPVEPKAPKTPKTPKEPVMKAANNARKRCGECEGCVAMPCGECEECKSVPDRCVERVCLNPSRGRVSSTPKVKPAWSAQVKQACDSTDLLGSKSNTNPKRFARCMECEGCKMPDCGTCKSCVLYNEHRDKIRDPVTCLNLVCGNPISLYGTRVDAIKNEEDCRCQACTMEPCGECTRCLTGALCEKKSCQTSRVKKAIKSGRHEDGACPLKVINGVVYDFRCYFCKNLPRVGSANRSELYRHYSVYHYSNEIKAEFGGSGGKCNHCKAVVKGGSFVSHMGQVHNEVEKYLPDIAKIPISVQGKGKSRLRRNNVVYAKKRNVGWIFPEIPEGWDPRGDTREITPPQPEPAKVIIDGFEIVNEVDEDVEPLFVTRDDPLVLPDYDGKSGKCDLCRSTFSEIVDAVFHIHARHGILGGSRHIMLDADRLLKGGYLSIPIDNVETQITEAGRGTYDDSLLEEEDDEGVEVEEGVTDIRPNLVSHLVRQTKPAEISA